MFSGQIVFRYRLLFLNTACKIVVLDNYKLILFHGMFESVLKYFLFFVCFYMGLDLIDFYHCVIDQIVWIQRNTFS